MIIAVMKIIMMIISKNKTNINNSENNNNNNNDNNNNYNNDNNSNSNDKTRNHNKQTKLVRVLMVKVVLPSTLAMVVLKHKYQISKIASPNGVNKVGYA